MLIKLLLWRDQQVARMLNWYVNMQLRKSRKHTLWSAFGGESTKTNPIMLYLFIIKSYTRYK